MQESVGNHICLSLEPLAVFPDANGCVVHCVQSCCFEADSGLDWVVPELAEVCHVEPTFGCGAVGHGECAVARL
jgi:hypothetical protein